MAVTIHIDHVKKAYEDNVVIHDLSVNIRPGELFTLLGPSGCPPSTWSTKKTSLWAAV